MKPNHDRLTPDEQALIGAFRMAREIGRERQFILRALFGFRAPTRGGRKRPNKSSPPPTSRTAQEAREIADLYRMFDGRTEGA